MSADQKRQSSRPAMKQSELAAPEPCEPDTPGLSKERTPMNLVERLRYLREKATPGTWYISELDGEWAAAVDAPLMKAIGESLGKIGGGPERPIGPCDFSGDDETYALECVNAVPALLDENERLRKAAAAALAWVENMRIVEGGERARLRDALRAALVQEKDPRE